MHPDIRRRLRQVTIGGTFDFDIGTAATKSAKAALASELNSLIRKRGCEDDPFLPGALSGEELKHATANKLPKTFGYRTNAIGQVIAAYVQTPNEIDETPEDVVMSCLAGANSLTPRVIKGQTQLVHMVSLEDIQIAKAAAKELNSSQLAEIGKKIWGDKYNKFSFAKLGIFPGK